VGNNISGPIIFKPGCSRLATERLAAAGTGELRTMEIMRVNMDAKRSGF